MKKLKVKVSFFIRMYEIPCQLPGQGVYVYGCLGGGDDICIHYVYMGMGCDNTHDIRYSSADVAICSND
jgi:hypothetical protein